MQRSHRRNHNRAQLRRTLQQVRVQLESRQRSDELKRKGNAGSRDSSALGLGRRATAEGRRGFQPTVGHHAKQSRRRATINHLHAIGDQFHSRW